MTLSVAEAAAALGVPERTVRRWIAECGLAATRPGPGRPGLRLSLAALADARRTLLPLYRPARAGRRPGGRPVLPDRQALLLEVVLEQAGEILGRCHLGPDGHAVWRGSRPLLYVPVPDPAGGAPRVMRLRVRTALWAIRHGRWPRPGEVKRGCAVVGCVALAHTE